jgi:hypothetical protein
MAGMTDGPADLRRIAAFLLSFARRQAAVVCEVPGGVAVLHPEFAASHEHNQLVLAEVPRPDDLPALAESALGHLPYRRITVLADTAAAAGSACAAALTEAGYVQASELVMRYAGPAPAAPDRPAQPVTPAELRSPMLGRLRAWMPRAAATTLEQLADRRTARLRGGSGAGEVCFLAARDEDGAVASWADLYRNPAEGIAQIEDLVTAETHLRRGYADTVLATALHRAADCPLTFLLADPDDWPRTWYARRGFTAVGRIHVFTRVGLA